MSNEELLTRISEIVAVLTEDLQHEANEAEMQALELLDALSFDIFARTRCPF